MEIAVVAIKPVLKKLGDLLVGEFTLENRVRKGIESLLTELTLMHAALRKVAEVPHEQLDEGVKIWAGNVRELSYHMEDIVDAFMVHVDDGGQPAGWKNRGKDFVKSTIKLFKKEKHLHRIYDALEEVVGQAKQLSELRQRYDQDIRYPYPGGAGLSTDPTCVSIDPRVMALYTDEKELVGIEETRDELVNMLLEGDDWSKHPLKTVSIVGFGGLGKTTLAKVAYEKIKVQFDCDAFVSISRKPNMKKVFKDILYELDKKKYASIPHETMDERQFIDVLIDLLSNKRYLIVIDDIWDENTWRLIKCAFSKYSPGSRIITTTRIVSVSHACCCSSDDIYRIRPLSPDVSRRLFHKRVFPHDKACRREFVQASEGFLQKCGGIPLAIITIASLLASNHQLKTIDQWYVLLNSIGRGLTEDRNMEDMKKILLFSYYDLPFYLKPCLLYLSIFPEDHKIIRAKLIWSWISEGFIYSEKHEASLYELGDSYFNELVNRSLIQPVGIDNEYKVEACRVHDMVLDLICSLSSEENFVTILDSTERKMPNTWTKVRRLSIQNSKVDVDTTWMTHVKSLTVFSNGNNAEEELNISSFQVLCVLDLEGCDISEIGYVGKLLHLRYLGLKHTKVEELPMEIGKLQLLQTLDLRSTRIRKLPQSVVRLRRLMCLYVALNMMLPLGIGNLTSLQVLEGHEDIDLSLGMLNLHVVKDLGCLTKLRVLRFTLGSNDESMLKALMESLSNLDKLEILHIFLDSINADVMAEAWMPSSQLRILKIFSPTCLFLTLPAWITPSLLPLLSYLYIGVDVVRPRDIQLLGMLPALRYLELWDGGYFTREHVVEMSVVTADAFPCATECHFNNVAVVPSIFPQGAAPRLKTLRFDFPAMWIARADFDLDLGHLPSLEIVWVNLFCKGASDREVREAEAALVVAGDNHPNHPILHIGIW
uniref:Uncharacterized protein n=2 Tax=Avena sativa TaxID=4498 RepID=A0ACD5VKW1_AVESA